MSEEEAAKVNEMLDDAARSAVNRLDLRSGFYTDPSAAGSWHHMSDEDINGLYASGVIFYLHSLLVFCHIQFVVMYAVIDSVWCGHFDEVALLNFETSLLSS